MRRLSLIVTFWLGYLSCSGSADEVIVGGRAFRVPEGFSLEKVAGPPLVDRPIVAEFDELGRLYVADSSGSNESVKKQEVDRPHRIVRLEDIDGDGIYDRSVVFADRMMFPAGAMWLDGSLYVAAPPSIWKLTDTDGDGVADRREEWFQGKTLTYCANDLHGPYAGPDGRIYWTKGAFGSQTYDRAGRKPLVTRAAHLFRAKPDGTEIEAVMTGGMDNPVEIAFTPEGERIFTTTFLQHPAGGNRDGLIHALYGGLYGKDHDVIDGHPRTSLDLLPPLVHLGPAAPSGLMRAESEAMGCRDHLFTACFNLRKITRHKLSPNGASFAAETDDFLSSDDLDFHPTDVLEDADGSLLIVDTGGWYKICCPTSQLVKPDVLGAIYRLKRTGAQAIVDPRGRNIAWNSQTPDDLANRLGDLRPALRRRAVASLARLGEPGLPAISRIIRESPSVEARRQAVWTACRVDLPQARALVREGLNDREASVRQVAAQASSVWRDSEAVSRLAEIVSSDLPSVRRAAAEALGRIEAAVPTIPALLQASESSDFALRHSATYALIEIGKPQAIRPALGSPSPLIRRTALLALDQMDGGQLDSGSVITLLSSEVPDLGETAWWIAGRHPEWGEALAGYFRSRLVTDNLHGPADPFELERRLGMNARLPAIQILMGEHFGQSRDLDLLLLRAMARSGVKEVPTAWLQGLSQGLGSSERQVISEAVATLRTLPLRPGSSARINDSLVLIGSRTDFPGDLRLNALAAIPGGLKHVDSEVFRFLISQLSPESPANSRTTSADILARATVDLDQVPKLLEALVVAGPLETVRLLDAFNQTNGDEIGIKLVDALSRSAARSSLRVELLKPRFERFSPQVRSAAEMLYRAIELDSADRRGQLEALLGTVKGGDIRRGQLVFNGSKASCVTCHAIGYVGGKFGPDLTKIGQVRAERDILEAIVFPSASFVRSYEPITVATRDGKVVSGLLRKDNADELVIAVTVDREERIARDQVEEVRPSTVSVMPAGLDKQLTPQELADLIAFLKACR